MAKEADFSDCEFFADEGIDVDSGGDDIATEGGGAKGGLDDFSGNSLGEIVVEKGDLAFVVGLVVVEAIPDNAASGDEFELIFLDDLLGHAKTKDELLEKLRTFFTICKQKGLKPNPDK